VELIGRELPPWKFRFFFCELDTQKGVGSGCCQMPVRPGEVPIVGLPPGASFPTHLPSVQGGGARSGGVAAKSSVGPALNQSPPSQPQPGLQREPAAASPSPAYVAPQLPGFGRFKYLPQQALADGEGGTPLQVGRLDASAFHPGQQSPPAGLNDPDLAPAGPLSSPGAPVTCGNLMQTPISPRSRGTDSSGIQTARLGPPLAQALFPAATMATDLPSDLSESTATTMPESLGAHAFSSMLSSLRKNDILHQEFPVGSAGLGQHAMQVGAGRLRDGEGSGQET